MDGENMIKDVYFPCRKFDKEVNEGECYDVQISTNGVDKICDKCEYNQLKSPEISIRKKLEN